MLLPGQQRRQPPGHCASTRNDSSVTHKYSLRKPRRTVVLGNPIATRPAAAPTRTPPHSRSRKAWPLLLPAPKVRTHHTAEKNRCRLSRVNHMRSAVSTTHPRILCVAPRGWMANVRLILHNRARPDCSLRDNLDDPSNRSASAQQRPPEPRWSSTDGFWTDDVSRSIFFL